MDHRTYSKPVFLFFLIFNYKRNLYLDNDLLKSNLSSILLRENAYFSKRDPTICINSLHVL